MNYNMKQFRITIVLTVLMSMFGSKAFAHDIEAANKDGVTIYYNWINDNTELSVTYQGDNYYWSRYYSGDVVIPESVEYEGKTYSVTSIGGCAFQNNSDLTSVSIPNSVTSIAMSAFEDCSGLTSVTIPNSVTSIGGWVFSGCSSLSSIIVESGNQHYDSRNQCNAIINSSTHELIAGCKNTVIPNSVTSIGDAAFYNCSGLTSVTIPSSVTSIGNQAFYNCSGLTSLTIPSSVTSIGGSSFSGCSGLTSIIVDDGNTAYDSRNNCNAIIEKTSNTLILGCNNTTIPEGVITISASAFNNCSGLTSVTIPNSVTSIGNSVFSGCSGLTSVTIPNSVTSIGNQVFYNCSVLTSVTIGNSVNSIGSSAFSGCSGLSSIIIEDGNIAYDSRNNCNAIIEKSSNTLIVGCKKTTIPNSVTSIGNSAFNGCSGLNTLTIPSSVTSIGEGAFAGCSGLTSVTIPNSISSIGNTVFNGCSGLTSVIIPNSVTSIGGWSFSGCSSLTSVTIPNSVTSIAEGAFWDCRALNEITCKADIPPTCGNNAFYRIDKSVCKLYVPKGHKTDYQAADQWKEFANIEEEASSETTEDVITIKDIGKTTWCSEYDLDFTNVEGIKAYTATGYDDIDKTIWLTRVMKVPAGTGILVKGDAGTYKIPHVNVRAYYTNMLVGNVGEAIKIEETDGDKTNYYLSGKDGTFVSVNGNANIGKNKAYLQLPTSVFAGTRSIGINYDDEDGTTGIKDVKSSGVKDGEWYTLQGQRVQNPGKGLYIKNGKKVVIK